MDDQLTLSNGFESLQPTCHMLLQPRADMPYNSLEISYTTYTSTFVFDFYRIYVET